jgi:hypothetical protein
MQACEASSHLFGLGGLESLQDTLGEKSAREKQTNPSQTYSDFDLAGLDGINDVMGVLAVDSAADRLCGAENLLHAQSETAVSVSACK